MPLLKWNGRDSSLGGTASIFSRIVFTIVGLAAIVAIPMLFEKDRPEQPGSPESE